MPPRSSGKPVVRAKKAPAKASKKASAKASKKASTEVSKKVPTKATKTPQKVPTKATKKASAALPVLLDTYRKLCASHPDAHCELDHRSAFELIVATVLSAQTTDVAVNKVTPGLFERYPSAEALARAEPMEVEPFINRIGMFRQKAKNIVGLARGLVKDHAGQVPADLDSLVALPGVGRKTANVVLGVAFQAPAGVVVDTHVQRISQRLGWTEQTTPEKIERDLMRLLPRTEWDRVSHTLIFHGRRICTALRPACSTCPVQESCPSAFAAVDVGRKPARPRA